MKYIDAEKLIAEIERRKKQDVTFRERSILIDIETAITSLQQEQPFPRWIHANYSDKPEIRQSPSGGPYLQSGPYMIWLSDLETLPKDGTDLTNPGPMRLAEADFEKEYKSYMKSRKDDLSGNAVTVNVKDLARHFYELGLNARKEDAL